MRIGLHSTDNNAGKHYLLQPPNAIVLKHKMFEKSFDKKIDLRRGHEEIKNNNFDWTPELRKVI